ncbi:MAG: GNAT family N-acetyltransferase [Bifidobacteriaceae bacterium]|jgi:putative glutathione S-transferase|nr:GNAT family N-acetyltransferase [Bifidobacteriaceae bacterium]
MSTSTLTPPDTSADLPAWAHRVDLGGGREIREARPDEFPAAEDVLVGAFTTGCWVSPGYQAGLRRLGERAQLFHVWVAADAADQILGLVLTPRLRYWDRPHFTFSVLSVGPAGRGLGLGRALVSHSIDLARSYGFDRIEIHSSPQMSRAHELYYRLGFVRRIDQETGFVSEFEERLLTFTYRLTDPLPADQVLTVPRLPAPIDANPFRHRRPSADQRATWPTPDAAARLAADRAARVERRLQSAGQLTGADQAIVDRFTAQISQDIGEGLRTAVYAESPDAVDLALRLAYARLDLLEARVARTGFDFLFGSGPSSADVLLFSLLLSFDLGQRAALPGFGPAAVAYWPHLWNLVRRVLALAELRPAELEEAGLKARSDGTFNEPYGSLPENFVLDDPRAAWLEPVAGVRKGLAPLDPSVSPTPWSGPLAPAARPGRDLKSELDSVAAAWRADAGEPLDEAAARFWRWIDCDLVDGIDQLAAGADALTQQALRRLFFARLSWLDALLGGQPYLTGAGPTAVDRRLARLLAMWGEDKLVGLTPIDPVLADFPHLAAYTNLA